MLITAVATTNLDMRFTYPRPRLPPIRSTAEDKVYTNIFDIGWDEPHRVLRNRTVSESMP